MTTRRPIPFSRLRSRGARCCTAIVAVGVEALLRWRTLPETCRVLGIRLRVGESRTPSRNSSSAPECIAQVRDEVDWVYSRFGLPDTCLRRALTAGFRLRAHEPRLVIGVKKAATLDAHAWLEAKGSVLDWAEKHGQYVPMR